MLRRIVKRSSRRIGQVGPNLLLDYNKSKLEQVKQKFIPECRAYSPYESSPSVSERLHLSFALIVPGRLSQIIALRGLSRTVRKDVCDGTNLVFWNPYSLYHHALDEFLLIKSSYILSPRYPLPRRCESFVGEPTIKEIYDFSGRNFVARISEHVVSGSDFCIAIYLSKLASHNALELRLVQFANFLASENIPMKVFLHYSDRDRARIDSLSPQAQAAICDGDSLAEVSPLWITISGISTVGIALVGISRNHFFVLGDQDDYLEAGQVDHSNPFYEWVCKYPNTLRKGDMDQEWMHSLFDNASESGFGDVTPIDFDGGWR